MIRRALLLLSVFQSLLSFAQTPDSTHLFSEPISFSNPVISLPFVTVQRSYDPYYIKKMEFKEPFGLRVKGGGFNSHRFLLNGIPVNNRLYNDIPLTDGSISLDKGWLSGRTPGQSSGVFVIAQPLPGKTILSTIELSGGTYFSSNEDLYPQRTKLDNLGNKNLKYSVSGPVPFFENLSFSTAGIFSQDGGYLSGANLYRTWDGEGNKNASGDSSSVLMNDFNRRSLSFRLLWNTDFFFTDFFVLYSRKAASYFSIDWLLTPEGNLRHNQEGIISGLTTNLRWSDSFTQTLKLSYQPTQTWGYLTENINSAAYVRSRYGSGYDDDQFYSFAGGYDNRRYRYKESLTVLALENQYSWNENQFSFLNAQTEMWWYHEEKGEVENLNNYGVFVPENPDIPVMGISLFSFTSSDHFPNKISIVGGHHFETEFQSNQIIVEAGLKAELFSSDGEIANLTNENPYGLFKEFLTGKTAESHLDLLPFLTASIAVNDRLVITGTLNWSADQASYSDFYTPERNYSLQNGIIYLIGNPELESVKWMNISLQAEWQVTSELKFQSEIFYKESERVIVAKQTYLDRNTFLYPVSDQAAQITYKGLSAGFSWNKNFNHFLVSSVGINTIFTAIGETQMEGGYNRFYYPYWEKDFDKESPNWIEQRSLNSQVFLTMPWNMSCRVSAFYSSGFNYRKKPYSWNKPSSDMGQTPNMKQVDFELEQKFPGEMVASSFFVKIENLFDEQNILNVYSWTNKTNLRGESSFESGITGRPNALTYRKTGAENPDFYSPPRKIVVGLKLRF